MTAVSANGAGEVTVDWDGIGDPPIYDTDHLLRRIGAIAPDRKQALGEAWVAHGYGELPPLLDAETYRTIEKTVSRFEPPATGDEAWHRLNAVADAIGNLHPGVRDSAVEALSVYAGISDPRALTVTCWPRIDEAERIIAEAIAYGETLGEVPSVDDLPPVDDSQEQVASDHYPGTKADAKTVEAWVRAGADETAVLNRAARAYAHEQDRATARKGLSAKLVEILGPEGLAKVEGAISAAAPPPLDLGAGVASGAEGGTAGPDVDEPSEPSPPAFTGEAEAEPAVPETDLERELGIRDRFLIADALADVGDRLTRLAQELAST